MDVVHVNPLSSAMCKVGDYVYIADREGVYMCVCVLERCDSEKTGCQWVTCRSFILSIN